MRRYWVPALLSRELPEPDCPPLRLKLLGERLVAFRDTQGRVGLLDELCAHRRASLFLGRNEDCGLRCVYHGWKYDVEGNCVDMPNEPPESTFKETIQLKAYPTREQGEMIWAYMGPKQKIPPPSNFHWTQVPEARRQVAKVWQECNWLQSMEGAFDQTHPAFLHRKLSPHSSRPGITMSNNVFLRTPTLLNLPKLFVERTDFGFYLISNRSWGEDQTHITIDCFAMPFHQTRQTTSQGQVKESMIEGHTWVPMDDENCMDFTWRCSLSPTTPEEMALLEQQRGRSPDTVDSNFRKIRNKDNGWLMDRQVQRTETYTGIDGINTQDHALEESMGPILDRTQEHLGSTDRHIIEVRRYLLDAVEALRRGEDPPGVAPPYERIRPKVEVLPNGVPWQEALK